MGGASRAPMTFKGIHSPGRMAGTCDDWDDSRPSSNEGEYEAAWRRRAARELAATRRILEQLTAKGVMAKEAISINMSALPEAKQYPMWRLQVSSKLTAASGRGDEAFRSITATEHPKSTFSSFAECGGVDALDTKIAAALMDVASGELGRKMRPAAEAERQADPLRMIHGRQLLWMVHDYHQYDEGLGAIMVYTDLSAITFRGDNTLRRS